MTSEYFKTTGTCQTNVEGQRRTLFTIQFGMLTAWLRDVMCIVALWKLIHGTLVLF